MYSHTLTQVFCLITFCCIACNFVSNSALFAFVAEVCGCDWPCLCQRLAYSRVIYLAYRFVAGDTMNWVSLKITTCTKYTKLHLAYHS